MHIIFNKFHIVVTKCSEIILIQYLYYHNTNTIFPSILQHVIVTVTVIYSLEVFTYVMNNKTKALPWGSRMPGCRLHTESCRSPSVSVHWPWPHRYWPWVRIDHWPRPKDTVCCLCSRRQPSASAQFPVKHRNKAWNVTNSVPCQTQK